MPGLLAPGEALLLRELAERWTVTSPGLQPLHHMDIAGAVARGVLERKPVRPGDRVYRYSLPEQAPETSQ